MMRHVGNRQNFPTRQKKAGRGLGLPIHRMAPPEGPDVTLTPATASSLSEKVIHSVPLLANGPALVASWTDLSDTRRRDLISALQTAIRIDAVPDEAAHHSSRQPEIATLSCEYLNKRLFRKAHAVYGIASPKNFSNILSRLRFILQRVGSHEPATPGNHMLGPDWQRLKHALASEHRRSALSGFMRYCSNRLIHPDAVTSDTLADFEIWLLQRTLCRDAPVRARAVASNWTWARANISGWPDVALTRSGMLERYVLPWNVYPMSLQEDARSFLDRLAFKDVGDIFPDDVTAKPGSRAGRTRALKPRTIEGRDYHIRQCLAALGKLGHDASSLTSLRSLVDPLDRAHAILTFFVNRAGGRRTSQTGQIGEVLRQIARFHCKLEPEAVDRITYWARNAAPKVVFAISGKNMRRLQSLQDPKKFAALATLPTRLMAEAADPTLEPHAAALSAMYATALNMLLRCPMRRSNLAGLRLDQHLVRTRGKLIDVISIGAHEMKNGKAMHWPIKSVGVAKQVQIYIDRYRPILTVAGNPYLFPQTGLKGRSAHDLAIGLKQLVETRIGCEFNLHIVRHLAAAIHLRHHAGQYDVVRKMLGHSATSYATEVYTPLGVDAVAQAIDDNIERAVAEGAKAARRKAKSKAYQPDPGPNGVKPDRQSRDRFKGMPLFADLEDR